MSDAAEDEPARVTVSLTAIVPTRDAKNPVRYTGSIVITIGTVEIVVDGVTLRREVDPRCGAVLRMRPPRFRHAATGEWADAIRLPREIEAAIGRAMLAEATEVRGGYMVDLEGEA